MEFKESAEDRAGDKWTLGIFMALSTEHFWNWDKSDGVDNDGDSYLGFDKCVNFEKDILFRKVPTSTFDEGP